MTTVGKCVTAVSAAGALLGKTLACNAVLTMAAAQKMPTEIRVAASIVRMVFMMFPFSDWFVYGHCRQSRIEAPCECDRL
jgi:hypothetical protein